MHRRKARASTPRTRGGSVRAASSDTVRVLLLSHLFTALLLLAVASAPLAAGWHALAVMNGSMRPAVSVGSTVVVAPVAADVQLASPAIVTFPDVARAEGMVTHRVVDRVVEDGQVHYVTKGDANPDPDSALVPHSALVGAVRLVVPYAGLPAVWAQQGAWPLLMLWGAALAAGTVVLVDLLRSLRGDPGRTSEPRR